MELLEVALGYAARGWRVLPVCEITEAGTCSCRKGQVCADAGKHPRLKGWPAKAATNAATIRGWWAEWPHASIGTSTGTT